MKKTNQEYIKLIVMTLNISHKKSKVNTRSKEYKAKLNMDSLKISNQLHMHLKT